MAGGYATVHGEIQEPIEETYDKTWQTICSAIKSTAPKGDFGKLTNATAFELGLAETLGVPDEHFRLLPDDPKTA